MKIADEKVMFIYFLKTHRNKQSLEKITGYRNKYNIIIQKQLSFENNIKKYIFYNICTQLT